MAILKSWKMGFKIGLFRNSIIDKIKYLLNWNGSSYFLMSRVYLGRGTIIKFKFYNKQPDGEVLSDNTGKGSGMFIDFYRDNIRVFYYMNDNLGGGLGNQVLHQHPVKNGEDLDVTIEIGLDGKSIVTTNDYSTTANWSTLDNTVYISTIGRRFGQFSGINKGGGFSDFSIENTDPINNHPGNSIYFRMPGPESEDNIIISPGTENGEDIWTMPVLKSSWESIDGRSLRFVDDGADEWLSFEFDAIPGETLIFSFDYNTTHTFVIDTRDNSASVGIKEFSPSGNKYRSVVFVYGDYVSLYMRISSSVRSIPVETIINNISLQRVVAMQGFNINDEDWSVLEEEPE